MNHIISHMGVSSSKNILVPLLECHMFARLIIRLLILKDSFGDVGQYGATQLVK